MSPQRSRQVIGGGDRDSLDCPGKKNTDLLLSCSLQLTAVESYGFAEVNQVDFERLHRNFASSSGCNSCMFVFDGDDAGSLTNR